MITINNLLDKKINNKALTKKEIYSFVKMSVNNEIKDYQISTMLNAIFFNGISFDENYWLTLAMRDSGYKFESKINRIDKHSTGGVGDKVTLILSPILASFGIPIFKISGRGLGYTGGTIDKLESIGVKTSIDMNLAEKILKKNNMAIMEQTKDIVPADKIFYSIRNDTCTVSSIPLIASSIMSKKLALGSKHIYLDIKIGDGALFKNINEAKKFANICIKIAKKEKKKIKCYFTNMNEPLGRAVGNKIEVIEALNFLQFKFDSKNLKKLIFQFVSDILIDFKFSKSFLESKKMINNKLISGEPFNKFVQWAKDQDSNLNYDDFKEMHFNPKNKEIIYAKKTGFFSIKSSLQIGQSVFDLGGGRINKDEMIDYDAGILFLVDNGDKVKKGMPLIEVYSNSQIPQYIISKIHNSFEIKNKKPPIKKIILGELK